MLSVKIICRSFSFSDIKNNRGFPSEKEGEFVQIKFKIWLEHNGEPVFGRGREVLLRAIEEEQSLYGAAKKLNMSYRAAWGRLKASETRLGIKLAVTDSRGKGMHLTNEARTLLAKFDKLERDAAAFLRGASDLFALKTVKKESEKADSQASTVSLPLFFTSFASLIPMLDPYLELL